MQARKLKKKTVLDNFRSSIAVAMPIKLSKKNFAVSRSRFEKGLFGKNKAIKKCLKPYFHFIFASRVFIFDDLTE